MDMSEISAVRTAATWLKKTGKPLTQYPKYDKLTERQRTEAQQFACGILPWPARWTLRLYHLATAG